MALASSASSLSKTGEPSPWHTIIEVLQPSAEHPQKV